MTAKVQIDPAIDAFNRQVKEASQIAPQAQQSLTLWRQAAEQGRLPWAAGGPVLYTEDLMLGPLQLRLYRPHAGENLPVLIYLHGGGWTLFSVDTHDRLMREYAHQAGCVVVGVNYSLSPECRFPVALDEVGQVLSWINETGGQLGLDPVQVALGGDSAGANLALATALRERDEGRHTLQGLLLNYGAYDRTVRPSHLTYDGEPFMLGASEMQMFWENYSTPIDGDSPYVQPLRADLTALPPSHLCIAEYDILLDENLELAERLQAAGVLVHPVLYRGATHSFLEALSVSTLAQRAVREGAQWLRAQFAADR